MTDPIRRVETTGAGIEHVDTNNQRRVETTGAGVEQVDTNNQRRVEAAGSGIEHVDTINYRRVASAGMMVEWDWGRRRVETVGAQVEYNEIIGYRRMESIGAMVEWYIQKPIRGSTLFEAYPSTPRVPSSGQRRASGGRTQQLTKDSANGTYAIRGTKASSYEYNFALALERYGIEYLYQVSYWGGRSMRGGMVLDFLVFTRPLYTPVWINGEYWHRSGRSQIDFLQQALLDAFSQGQLAPAKVYWGKDVETYEAALSTVRRDFGV